MSYVREIFIYKLKLRDLIVLWKMFRIMTNNEIKKKSGDDKVDMTFTFFLIIKFPGEFTLRLSL